MKIDTFWKRNKIQRPKKQFALLFVIWDDKSIKYDCEEFNTIDDCTSTSKELESLYKEHHRLPIKISSYCYDYSGDRSFWGYAIFDMYNHKVLKIKNAIKYSNLEITNSSTINKDLKIRDDFFRDVVVEDYEFSCWEEYNGWLRYRWGDGKNAI